MELIASSAPQPLTAPTHGLLWGGILATIVLLAAVGMLLTRLLRGRLSPRGRRIAGVALGIATSILAVLAIPVAG